MSKTFGAAPQNVSNPALPFVASSELGRTLDADDRSCSEYSQESNIILMVLMREREEKKKTAIDS